MAFSESNCFSLEEFSREEPELERIGDWFAAVCSILQLAKEASFGAPCLAEVALFQTKEIILSSKA